MAKTFKTVSINVFSVKTDKDTKDLYLDVTARDYAAPANVTAIDKFVEAVEGVQLYTLYRKYAAKEATTKDVATKKRCREVMASIDSNMRITSGEAAVARYTVAGMVGFAFFSACRGNVNGMELLPSGASMLYEAAEKALNVKNKNDIDCARRDIHAAIETLIKEFTVNEGESEFSKVWRTRIKKNHIDAAISHANYTRTTYDKRAMHTRDEKKSEVAREVVAQVLRDCFSFTEVKPVKTTKW